MQRLVSRTILDPRGGREPSIRFRTAMLVAIASVAAAPAIAAPSQRIVAAERETNHGDHRRFHNVTPVQGGTLYFGANDENRGAELWRSDGTARGTRRVKDILPGPHGSFPSDLAEVSGTLYFVAENRYESMDPERELWRSDGTQAGTSMLKDTGCTSGEGHEPTYPRAPVGLNGLLFFTSCDGTFHEAIGINEWGREVWRSNGTRAGTRILKEINPTGTALPSAVGATGDPLVANDMMFFGAWDGVHGHELWGSDGTADGTYMIEDIHPDNNSFCCPGVTPVSVAGGVVFLAADDGVNGRELWRTDGTADGTYMIKDINPSGGSLGRGYQFARSTQANGVLYFGATDGIHGEELWRSDGTEAGTYMVKDINPSRGSRPGSLPRERRRDPYGDRSSFMTVNGVLYFSATDGVSGMELWRTDGTEPGTWLVKNINRTPLESDPNRDYPSSPDWLTGYKGRLLFAADNGRSGVELWHSDGTSAGTVKLTDINRDGSSYPAGLTRFKRWVFVRATNVKAGMELWRTNGTRRGTKILRDLNVGSRSSTPYDFVVVK